MLSWETGSRGIWRRKSANNRVARRPRPRGVSFHVIARYQGSVVLSAWVLPVKGAVLARERGRFCVHLENHQHQNVHESYVNICITRKSY